MNKKELVELQKLLEKIENPSEGLPRPLFDALCKIVPFIACELIIKDKAGGLFLTFRRDKWWTGWHFPGGLLRYGETFENRLKETAKTELGVKIHSIKFLFPQNHYSAQGPRGHAVSLLFLCVLGGKPQQGKFFREMPKNIIKEHKYLWKKLRQQLM